MLLTCSLMISPHARRQKARRTSRTNIQCAKAPSPPPRCSQVAVRIHLHWILGSLVVLDLFLLCCMMERTQEQITFWSTLFWLHFHWILHCLGIILVGPKGAKMMPRAPKKVAKWYPGSPKFNENEARGTQSGTNGKKSKKIRFFGPFPPPIWAPILTHFR